jgi:hypothetical protein
MIGKEEEQQEVTYKVADRRKFNPDGSVKEGVTLDAEPVREKTTAPPPKAEKPAPEAPSLDAGAGEESDQHDDLGEEGDIPGADDPASFVNFLPTIATNAAAALGAVPHPSTGKRSLDLETGKYWLDVLGMIKEKTKNNLHKEEQRILDVLLSDLRMQYVTMVRATEEKLKAQAAAKFSGEDILGKK